MKTTLCTLLVTTAALAQTPSVAPPPVAPPPVAPPPVAPPPGATKSAPAMPTSAAQVLERSLAGVERQFVPAADAMPEAAYGYTPTGGDFKGVKTYAQQVKHIAMVNYALGAAIAGEKSTVDAKELENGSEAMKSKAEIVKFLKDSFVVARKAVGGIKDAELIAPIPSPFGPNQTTRLNLAMILTSHAMDHYGQMVVYLRHNGIIPPASRR